MNTTVTHCDHCHASTCMFFYMEWECQSNFAKDFDFLCTIIHNYVYIWFIHKKGLIINLTIQAVVQGDYILILLLSYNNKNVFPDVSGHTFLMPHVSPAR